jgi:hypothetical protein
VRTQIKAFFFGRLNINTHPLLKVFEGVIGETFFQKVSPTKVSPKKKGM